MCLRAQCYTLNYALSRISYNTDIQNNDGKISQKFAENFADINSEAVLCQVRVYYRI